MKLFPLVLRLAFMAVATSNPDDCPKDFKIKVFQGGEGVAARLSSAHSVLVQCPQLATIDIRFDHSGCVSDGTPSCIPFTFSGGDHIPSAPEAVSLAGYDLEYREWHRLRPVWATQAGLRYLAEAVHEAVVSRDWESIEYTSFYRWIKGGYARRWFAGLLLSKRQRLKTNLELWLDAMDFSRVRHIALIDCYWSRELLAEKFLPRVPGLRSLEIAARGSPGQADLVRFVATNTLQHLSLQDTFMSWDQVKPLIARHGQSLISLDWSSFEAPWGSHAPMLAPTDLEGLRALTPNLRELRINLERNDTSWPWAELDALKAEAPLGLANLTVYFNRASEGVCTRLDVDAATHMFRRLVADDHVARPWHTVRFSSAHWPLGRLEGSWVICSTRRPGGALKAPGETLCTSLGYLPPHCDEHYAKLAFKQRQEAQRNLLGSLCLPLSNPRIIGRDGCFNY